MATGLPGPVFLNESGRQIAGIFAFSASYPAFIARLSLPPDPADFFLFFFRELVAFDARLPTLPSYWYIANSRLMALIHRRMPVSVSV